MKKMLQYMTHFSSELAQEPKYFLNGEITAEARTAYSALHRLMLYFRTKLINMEVHSSLKKIIIVYFSTTEN